MLRKHFWTFGDILKTMAAIPKCEACLALPKCLLVFVLFSIVPPLQLFAKSVDALRSWDFHLNSWWLCEALKTNRQKRFKPFYGARKLGLAHVRFRETSKCAFSFMDIISEGMTDSHLRVLFSKMWHKKSILSVMGTNWFFYLSRSAIRENIWMIPMMMVIALAVFSIVVLLLCRFIFLFCCLFVFLFFIGRYYAKKLSFLTFYAPWRFIYSAHFWKWKRAVFTTLFFHGVSGNSYIKWVTVPGLFAIKLVNLFLVDYFSDESFLFFRCKSSPFSFNILAKTPAIHENPNIFRNVFFSNWSSCLVLKSLFPVVKRPL